MESRVIPVCAPCSIYWNVPESFLSMCIHANLIEDNIFSIATALRRNRNKFVKQSFYTYVILE